MKKLILLVAVLVFWGCEEEADAINIVGYTPTGSILDPTNWEGTDNLDVDNSWQFNFWNYEGNLLWRFEDTCENSCMGGPYTLNTNVTPNEIDLVVNIDCFDESYFGETVIGIIDIQKETIDGTISFTGLTIAISEPGSDSRPTSFDDAYRVWDLDYLDIDDIFYVDDFFVVDTDDDGDLLDEYECGGENLPDGPDACGIIDPIFDPIGFKIYKTSQLVYDSPTECSGSSETHELVEAFDYYYEFTDDGISSNVYSYSNEWEYCIYGSSLYLYYINETGLGEPTEVGTTYTMTSDSTFHIQYEAGCSYCCHDNEEDCNENTNTQDPWKHCRITHWEAE